MFLQPDGTFWFQLVNFAIFFAILSVVFLRPVGEAIKKRRAHIDAVHQDYNSAAERVKSARAEAEQKRSAARREADETIARARSSAEAEATTIVAERTTEAQAIAELARATVAGEAAAARARSDELVRALAASLVDRAVGTAP